MVAAAWHLDEHGSQTLATISYLRYGPVLYDEPSSIVNSMSRNLPGPLTARAGYGIVSRHGANITVHAAPRAAQG